MFNGAPMMNMSTFAFFLLGETLVHINLESSIRVNVIQVLLFLLGLGQFFLITVYLVNHPVLLLTVITILGIQIIDEYLSNKCCDSLCYSNALFSRGAYRSNEAVFLSKLLQVLERHVFFQLVARLH